MEIKTKQTAIDNHGKGMEEALAELEIYTVACRLEHRTARRLRLLAEETMGMVRGIVGDYEGTFYIVGDENECRMYLKSQVEMDKAKKEDFLRISSTGRNDSAKGFMGKIRDMIENGVYRYEENDRLLMEYGLNPMAASVSNMQDPTGISQAAYMWSMAKYRRDIEETTDKDEQTEEAWDELEKSIVANLADEVTVGVYRDNVELMIYKKL